MKSAFLVPASANGACRGLTILTDLSRSCFSFLISLLRCQKGFKGRKWKVKGTIQVWNSFFLEEKLLRFLPSGSELWFAPPQAAPV